MKILCLVLAIMFIFAGCSKSEPADSSSEVGGYASDVLEYVDASDVSFTLGNLSSPLSVGDSFGDYKVETLLSRTTDSRFKNIRADFSCDITLRGRVRYNKSSTYKNILQFYPEDASVFPRVTGDVEPIVWVIIRQDNDPLSALGLTPGTESETAQVVRVKRFSINYTEHSTTNYITVEIVKPE
ncbi:MAG: hypothetical protein IJ426_01620 [Clostridia bacterium]|nr:hypothetical protein [Clostridia bacterium]